MLRQYPHWLLSLWKLTSRGGGGRVQAPCLFALLLSWGVLKTSSRSFSQAQEHRDFCYSSAPAELKMRVTLAPRPDDTTTSKVRPYVVPAATPGVVRPFFCAVVSRMRQVRAFPSPSRSPTPGRLSVDLHMLRRSEAINVVESVLIALEQSHHIAPSTAAEPRSSEGPTTRKRKNALSPRTPASSLGVPTGVQGKGFAFSGETFKVLEIVVGRGSHSAHGIAKLRPVVAQFLESKGLHTISIGGEQEEGAIFVNLSRSKR